MSNRSGSICFNWNYFIPSCMFRSEITSRRKASFQLICLVNNFLSGFRFLLCYLLCIVIERISSLLTQNKPQGLFFLFLCVLSNHMLFFSSSSCSWPMKDDASSQTTPLPANHMHMHTCAVVAMWYFFSILGHNDLAGCAKFSDFLRFLHLICIFYTCIVFVCFFWICQILWAVHFHVFFSFFINFLKLFLSHFILSFLVHILCHLFSGQTSCKLKSISCYCYFKQY